MLQNRNTDTDNVLALIHIPFDLRCRIKCRLHEFFNMDKDLTEEDYKEVSAFAYAKNIRSVENGERPRETFCLRFLPH